MWLGALQNQNQVILTHLKKTKKTILLLPFETIEQGRGRVIVFKYFVNPLLQIQVTLAWHCYSSRESSAIPISIRVCRSFVYLKNSMIVGVRDF